MARLSIAPIVSGHWKGLSNRVYRGVELVSVAPDVVSRLLSVGIPGTVAVLLLAVVTVPNDAETLRTFLGVALTWSALVSAGLLGTFTLLAGWRGKLSGRAARDDYYRARQKPLTGLIDEAVAHCLFGVLDALLIATLAVLAMLPHPDLSRWAIALGVAAAGHTVFLFVLIATRVYSAYVQAEDVDEVVDGFAGASTRQSVRPPVNP